MAHAYGGGYERILEVHWPAILAHWSAPVSAGDSTSRQRTIEASAQSGRLACTGVCEATCISTHKWTHTYTTHLTLKWKVKDGNQSQRVRYDTGAGRAAAWVYLNQLTTEWFTKFHIHPVLLTGGGTDGEFGAR